MYLFLVSRGYLTYFLMLVSDILLLDSLPLPYLDENLSASSSHSTLPRDRHEGHSISSTNQLQGCTFLMFKNSSTYSTDLSKNEIAFLLLSTILILLPMRMQSLTLDLRGVIVVVISYLLDQEISYFRLRRAIPPRRSENISKFVLQIPVRSALFIFRNFVVF